MGAILRQSYLEKIERYLGKDTIIILTGQRRIGKSYILRLFRDKVNKDEQANIIFIDKEKHEFDDIKTYQDLNAYIDARRDKNKTNYILVDEIQDIEEFEKSIRSYYEEPDNGLRNALAGGSREGDIEKVIENIIYNHLIRLGYEVTVGQLQAGEVDFVCKKPKGQRIYVQAGF